MEAHWVGTAIAVVVLACIAAGTLSVMRVPASWESVVALVRAALQLATLSLILTGIISDPLWVAIGLVVMLAAAFGTAARRGAATGRDLIPLAAAIVAGPVVVLGVVFATGAVELSPRYALAIGGIIIGNTMTIAILTRRLFREAAHQRWDEVEGWLALGATPWQSTRELARGAIRSALLPSIDQTRTTGIVVLPGAFVGAVFAGASPLEAGRFQLVVLAGILAAGAVTATLLLRLGDGVRQKPPAPAVGGRG